MVDYSLKDFKEWLIKDAGKINSSCVGLILINQFEDSMTKTPRYKLGYVVTSIPQYIEIQDTHNDNESVADFWDRKGFDAKKEAQSYAEYLNKKEND